MLQLVLRVVHLFGAVFWLGGIVTVTLAVAAYEGSERGKVAAAARGVALKLATPGMILAFVGGLTMLAMGWSGYARAGWMHGKLLLVVIAAGLTGALTGKLRKAAAGQEVGGLGGLAIGLVVLTALVLVLGWR